jgi:hypothetical protein
MSEDIISVNISEDILKVNIQEEVIQVDMVATVNYNVLDFQWVDPPATRNSPGTPGQMSFNDDYFFICVAQDLWARTILTKGF